jgi:hypothetical protein
MNVRLPDGQTDRGKKASATPRFIVDLHLLG